MRRVLGRRYRVVEPLGGGGTSLVYRAEVMDGGADVAIKELRPQFAADPILRRRFVREAELARGLDHPGIVKILDAGEEEGLPFIALELVRAETLRQRLDREGRLKVATAWSIFVALAQALDHAHARGVIHRDVKPQNVFVGPRGVKLTDFGSARLVSLASVTGASLTWGTPEYVAPEMFMRGRADPRSDLYALGVVLYEMLTGRHPWCRVDTLARLAGRAGKDLPFVPTGARHDVDRVLSELLAFSPADRPASGEEARLRVWEPDASAPASSTSCAGCGSSRPDDVPRCLSCGQEVLRLGHDPVGYWRIVLDRLEDDAAATEKLFSVCNPLVQRVEEPLHFLTGDRTAYSDSEYRSGIELPAVLFSHLDERTARVLESLFRGQGLDVRAVEGTVEVVPVGGNARGMTLQKALGIVVPLVALGGAADSLVLVLVCGGFAAVGLGLVSATLAHRKKQRILSAQGLLRLRDQLAAVPIADDFLADLARATAQIRAPEVRALLGAVSTEIYRLTRRAAELGGRAGSSGASLEADPLRRTLAATPALAERIRKVAVRLDELDAALEGGSEGELMQALARLERAAAASGADRSMLAATRGDLEATLERRHATEQQRARLSARLCQLLGRLRQVYRRARSIETIEEQEARAIETSSAELEAFLAAGS